MSSVVFYDLPSKEPRACWSPNPWKTRLLLNYKGIDYKTEWLEYPDLGPTLKSLGVAPNKDGPAEYTSPTVRLGDSCVMDSVKIASAVEAYQPTPSAHLDSPILPRVEEQMMKVLPCFVGLIVPKIPGALLNPPSFEHFERTRERTFGMPLAQLEKEKGGEDAWMRAKEPIEELAAILKANGGPFFMGETVSYADFLVVALLQCQKRLGGDLFERMLSCDQSFGRLYDASKQWLARDSY